MDVGQLLKQIDSCLPKEYQQLTSDKVSNRAENIREQKDSILFDIERHPGAGSNQVTQPHTVMQTWKYSKKSHELEMVWEFDCSALDALGQNDEGKPFCRNCNEVLDLFADVYGNHWHCKTCGAAGGNKSAIFDTLRGPPIVERDHVKKVDKYLWIPKEE